MDKNDKIEISKTELDDMINRAVDNKVEEIENEINIINSRLDHMSDYSDEIQEDVASLENEWEHHKELIMSSSNNVSLSPAEKLLNGAGWEDINLKETENRVRAMHIINHWENVREKSMGFYTLKIKDIKNTLDNIDDYQTAKRIAKQVDKMTDGIIYVKDTPHSGKMLCMDKSNNLNKNISDLF